MELTYKVGMNQVRSLVVVILLLMLWSCLESKHTYLELFDLSIEKPIGYVEMNHTQFGDYFLNKKYSDSLVLQKKENIEALERIPVYVYLQDTINIHNNILLMQPPYIHLSQKTFKSIKQEINKTMKSNFPNHEVKSIESDFIRGTYPYGKFKYQIRNCQEDFVMTYYVLNKSNTTNMIVVNNKHLNDFERIIKTIE